RDRREQSGFKTETGDDRERRNHHRAQRQRAPTQERGVALSSARSADSRTNESLLGELGYGGRVDIFTERATSSRTARAPDRTHGLCSVIRQAKTCPNQNRNQRWDYD